MDGLLGTLGFMQPLILMALVALPVLWLILRLTPPPPKKLHIPTFRFLADLIPPEHTARKMPIWLLLLRMAAAALIILGFAGPILNAQNDIPPQATPRLVIDNGWAAAAQWDDIQAKALALVEEADRSGKTVKIVLTAQDPQNADLTGKILTASEARSRIRALEPRAWAPDYKLASEGITADTQGYYSFFLSAGVDGKDIGTMTSALVKKGGLSIALPRETKLPYLLRRESIPNGDETGFIVTLRALNSAQTNAPLTLQALDSHNTIIHSVPVAPDGWGDDFTARVSIALPSAMARKVQRIQLREQKTAGSTLIVDPSLARKFVGLVELEGDRSNKAYLGASFYLRRALDPYADIVAGSFDDVFRQNPSVIILPDDIAFYPTQLNALQDWINEGGVLIRFAGPRLAQATSPLLPVLLRLGGRSMDGQVSWDKAQSLAPFAEKSLFFGLSVPEDLKVRQMVLADPSQDLKDNTWASLADGTPLVTFKTEENGLIVLIHTAATPDWSNLPLTGLYVEMLKRVIDLSGQGIKPAGQLNMRDAFAMLDPIYTLGAFGQATPPSPLVKPLRMSDSVTGVPLSPVLQAGIYARGGVSRTINVSDSVIDFNAVTETAFPRSARITGYAGAAEQRPGSALLYLALLLLCVDLLAMLVMLGSVRRAAAKGAATALMIFALATVFVASPARATTPEMQAEYANELYLAYIKSGDESVDSLSEQGLEELSIALTQRTSVEPIGVAGIDLFQDDLVFFPLIYWPVTPNQRALPPIVLKKVQNYINNGGMILFDVKQGRGLTGGQSSTDLQRLIGPLTLPPLEVAPKDHVLRRSFYLLDEFPGVYPDYPLWLEQHDDGRATDASSVLIGSNDWAPAWARGGGSRQNEMALRFGINLVMYALTGNYKTDQIHVKHILERLGE